MQYFLKVYFADLPENSVCDLPAVSSVRLKDIYGIRSRDVKREKVYVWKLLENAIQKELQLDISDIFFFKDNFGKWSCNVCNFSLSHSGNLLAVALSDKSVGVDVQIFTPPKSRNFSKRILDSVEFCEYGDLDPELSTDYLMSKWTQKEAIFKMIGGGAYIPSRIHTTRYNTYTDFFERNGSRYFFSVASEYDRRDISFVNPEFENELLL